jgi:iron complex outermembrane recepter protein
MTHRKSFPALKTLIGAMSVIAALPSARAQESIGLEEITVTAQRREQSLQDVGVSVSALGAEQLRERGITGSLDIGKFAPGVVFAATSSAGAFSSLSVRGVSQSDFSPIQESPNASYMDDVYIASNGATSFPVFDLERIEVLRGPQGTLFGRNSTGGLAHFITAKPTSEAEGYIEAGVGDYSQYWAEAAVSGPLSDRVRGRISGKLEKTDGWWENRVPGAEDTMETDARSVRAHLEVDLTEQLLARLTLSHGKRPEHRAGTYKQKNFYFDASGVPAEQSADLDAWGTGPGANLIGYRDTGGEAQRTEFEDFGRLETSLDSATLMLQWTLGETTITSLTNYNDFSMDYLEDTDASPFDYMRSNSNVDQDQWSQELRATGASGDVRWTVGAYVLDIDNDSYTDYFFPLLSGSDFAFDDYQDLIQSTKSWAAFGQAEWALSDALDLTVGARYTRDRKTFDTQVYFRELGNGYFGGTGSSVFDPPFAVYDFRKETVGGLASLNEGLWSGKIQLDYRPAEGTLLYAGISRGVKGPGFNANLGGGLTIEETPFESETVLSYEIGGKFDLLDQRLRLNGSVYYYDYSDYQGYAWNGIQGLVGNYDAEFYGADLELLAMLPGDLRLSLGGAWSETTVEDVPTVYAGVRDQDAVMAPEWIVNGSLQKTVALGSGELSFVWSFDYIDDRYASVDNNPATAVKGSTMHNLRVAWTLPDSGLELAAFLNNVTDTERQLFTYDLVAAGGFTISPYDKPRWWGASIRKSF